MRQGDLELLNDPVAQELLHSKSLARLAYIWRDGTPRVIPVWFHWNDRAIVLGTMINAPKMKILPHNSRIALTIDRDVPPYKVLLVRGTAHVEVVEGVTPEFLASAQRYFGEAQGRAWLDGVRQQLFPRMGRITVQPEWVGIIDSEKRLPSAVEAAMAGRLGPLPKRDPSAAGHIVDSDFRPES